MTLDSPFPAVAEAPKEELSEPKLSDDVKATIARGEAAFLAQRKKRRGKRPGPQAATKFLTSVVDVDVQDRRDARLKQVEDQSKGKRGQPPMLDRLRAATIAVDRYVADGISFATGRNSIMNKRVREFLHGKAVATRDRAKSRVKRVAEDTVRDLLRKVKGLSE
jgi:hypothetical protein